MYTQSYPTHDGKRHRAMAMSYAVVARQLAAPTYKVVPRATAPLRAQKREHSDADRSEPGANARPPALAPRGWQVVKKPCHRVWTTTRGRPSQPSRPLTASRWASTGAVGARRQHLMTMGRHLVGGHLVGDKLCSSKQSNLVTVSFLTSTVSNFYTGQKFTSKIQFYGRVAAEGILALHMKIVLFTAAERPKRILASKVHFYGPLPRIIRYKKLKLYL